MHGAEHFVRWVYNLHPYNAVLHLSILRNATKPCRARRRKMSNAVLRYHHIRSKCLSESRFGGVRVIKVKREIIFLHTQIDGKDEDHSHTRAKLIAVIFLFYCF